MALAHLLLLGQLKVHSMLGVVAGAMLSGDAKVCHPISHNWNPHACT